MALSDDFKRKLLQPLDDLFRDAASSHRPTGGGGRNYQPAEAGKDPAFTSVSSTRGKRKKLGRIDEEALRQVRQEIASLVGLRAVKETILRLVNLARVDAERRHRKLPSITPSLHMAFLGNPGTGKTTIARLLGRFLNASGFLSEGHTVETDKADLVGGFLGQTPGIVSAKIEEARGGVLFIDEAYLLSETVEDLYGREAIGILLKRMEDYRDDLVVIAAGYPEKMQGFLKSNPGLRSRFARMVHFSDYSPADLQEIFLRLCQEKGFLVTPGLLLRAEITWERLDHQNIVSEGNGRLVRSALERVAENQAARLSRLTKHPVEGDLTQLLPTDWDGVEDLLRGGGIL